MYSVYKRAFWIGMILPILQQLTCVNGVLSYATTIFEKIVNEYAQLMMFIVNITNFVFTVVSLFTSDNLGRRFLMVIGSILCTLTLASCYIFYGNSNWVFAGSIFLFMAAFGISHGPIWYHEFKL